jgi:hypothetical protein
MWVAFLTHNCLEAATETNNPPGWRERLQAAGVTVVASGWSDPRLDLVAQADAVAHFSAGFDEYIANLENGPGWGYPGAGFLASDSYAPMIRARTKIPISVSIEWGEALHFKPWLDIGMEVVRPQCYVNDHPWMTPAEAVKRAEQAQADLPAGLRADQVEPSYGTWGSSPKPMSEYTQLHFASPCKAASCWAGEFLDEPEIDVLAAMRR